MALRNSLVATFVGVAAMSLAAEDPKRFEFELETGLAAPRYNYAQVPKATGTRLDLASVAGKESRSYARMALLYHDSNGGTWKLLYAPYRRSGVGALAAGTSFDGVVFGAGNAEAVYQFNSYRLTYRKGWKGNWSIGGTLKIRDAEIRLTQGGTRASEKNVGFVPLLNIYGTGKLVNDFVYEVELDGLAGGPGRAFDLSARVKKPIGRNTEVFAGYRLLEGGADVPKVKNFAWINYFSFGVSVRF